jgi:Fe-S oxidoreductase
MSVFSKNWTNLDTIKACRFCWMCRHVCTVGNVTAKESDTPRGKTLLLYSTLMEVTTPSTEMANVLYNCALCYRCKEECVGGFDVPQVILDTRAEVADDGLCPDSVMRRVESLREEKADDGNTQDEARWEIESNIGCLPEKAAVVLFGGHSTSNYTPAALLGAAKLLRKAGVDFTLPKGDNRSGFEFYEMGFLADAKKEASFTVGAINEALDSCRGDRTVIVLDPSDGWALQDLYGKWGVETSFEVVDFSSFVHKLAKEERIKFLQRDLELTYHDPCHLGRLHRVFAQPRELLNMIPGVVLREMHWNQSQAHCCGGHLRSTNPETADKVGTQRIEQVEEIGVHVVVTGCPTCCDSLDRAKENIIDDLEVYHIAEFLADSID